MSATLTARQLAAGHGNVELFSGLDLIVAPGDVIGLVGANGAGKSTLLRMLAGLDLPERGTVSLSPPTATVGYLPQERDRSGGETDRSGGEWSGGERDRSGGETVRDVLARRTGVAAAQRALDAASVALERGERGAGEAYAVALERWLGLGAADLDERAEAVTAELGLTVDLDRPVAALSGGQAARAGLASLLLSRYDVLLLDEPTNDLDLAGLALLEDFVLARRAGTVLVSHDRRFLERTVDRVLELDLPQHRVNQYGGGYAGYLAERETQRRHARLEYEEYAETKAGLEARARAQRAWADKGVRNVRRNLASEPDRSIRAYRVESSQKQAAKAKQTEKMIERLDVVEEPRREWELRMHVAAAPRSGAVVAVLRGAVVRRGPFTLGPVDLQIDWADRVAITGANGSGKSTLLAALLGRIPPDEGTAALGPGVVVGEIDQARALFLGAEPLLDAFTTVSGLLPAEARTLLAKFGLRADHVLRPAGTLSPGERTRAALALLQAVGVNLLVLDEPTNHLDLPAIEQLEQALDSYEGTLLLVTHDRHMLEVVRTTRHLEVDAGKVRDAG